MGPLFPQVKQAMVDVQAYARSHGGEIQLLGVSEEGDVKIKFSGLTLKHGIESQLRELVPGVKKIIQI
jgi:Fe-S cluster biogenesis protein NfuA